MALSQVIGSPLPYEELMQLRERMFDVSPTLLRYDVIDPPDYITQQVGFSDLARRAVAGIKTAAPKDARQGPFIKVFDDFYRTDSISRNSVTMAQCSKAFTKGLREGNEAADVSPRMQ